MVASATAAEQGAAQSRLHQPRGVARHQVDFEVDAGRPSWSAPSVVTVSVCGMISTENVSAVDLVHRQRDAVERDRAFLRDEARERLRRAQASSAPCRSGPRAQTSSAMPSTWPATMMAAEFVADLERALEIEARAVPPAPAVVSAASRPRHRPQTRCGRRPRRSRPRSGRRRSRRSRRRSRSTRGRRRRRS